MTRLYVLADDSMLGREAATLGNVKATDYIAHEMQRMGLAPGGENGTYFQSVPVMIARIDTTRTISVDGARLGVGTDVLPFYAGTAPTMLPRAATTRSVEGAQAVFGGQLGSGSLITPAQATGKLMSSSPCRPTRPADATTGSTSRARSPSTGRLPALPPSCSTSFRLTCSDGPGRPPCAFAEMT